MAAGLPQDLRAVHDEAAGETAVPFRAIRLEQDTLHNLVVEILAYYGNTGTRAARLQR